jgi:hypothetical protein
VIISLTAAGEQWLAPVATDVMRSLSTEGVRLFRALRVMMAHATTEAAPPRPIGAGLDVEAWRTQAPPVV